jgi:hypothetical protein
VENNQNKLVPKHVYQNKVLYIKIRGDTVTIFDIAYDDAIRNSDNSFLEELFNIQDGKYDGIDNEIKSILEVSILLQRGSMVYYWDRSNNVKQVAIVFIDLIKEQGYRHNLELNMEVGNIKFLRKNIGY